MVGNDDVMSMYAIGLGRAWEGAWEGVFFLSLSLTYTHIRTFIYAAVRSIAVVVVSTLVVSLSRLRRRRTRRHRCELPTLPPQGPRRRDSTIED